MGTEEKAKWRIFAQAKDSSDLEKYFVDRAYSHGKYCHYTKVGTINNILEKYFYVSCVSGFNDECDKRQFGDEKEQKYFYSLCFATGDSENLPLWYLYSGVDGKGGRLQFTKTIIKQLINNSKYVLYEFDKDKKELVEQVLVLQDNVNMKLKFQDILYYQEQGETVRLKYNTMTINKFPLSEFNRYKEDNKGFFKNIIWFYEKESRLLIELIGDARAAIEENKKYVVVMSFPFNLRCDWLKIRFAPEISQDAISDIEKNNENILKFSQQKGKLIPSAHAGQVHMKICDRCEHNPNKKR